MVIRIAYSIALLCWGAVELPSMLKRAKSRKKWLFRQKIGMTAFPPFSTSKRVWIHSVSLGETKAAEPLIKAIKRYYPEISIYCSHATLTGYDTSSKNPLVDFSFILPLDLPILMNRLVKKIAPKLFILVESDYWPSLMEALGKQQVPVSVVNGKLSDKTYKIYSRLPFLKNFTFERCHQVLVQNEEYFQKFIDLGVKNPEVITSGNMKFDIERSYLNEKLQEQLIEEILIPQGKPIITFGCTHENEESLITQQIKELLETTEAFIIIAPRHLERVGEMVVKLSARPGQISLFSKPVKGARVLLIDRIGVLDQIYQLSMITILCGSFVPGIGGHNLFEPLEAGSTLLYGPYVEGQKEMDDYINQFECGLKVSAENLSHIIKELMISHDKRREIQQKTKQLLEAVKGSAEKTFRNIEKFIGD